MDYILARTIGTVVMFAVFVAIAVWAFSNSQKRRFNEDALIPFREGDEFGQKSSEPNGRKP
jgi:cbb3-type cytochrome oxidase subunit 3